MKINKNFLNLNESYLFSTIAKKVNDFKISNPNIDLIRLGIGDVTKPLCPSVIEGLHKAVDEMSNQKTFKGYGPEQGYDFLRQNIKSYYQQRNISLNLNEIFISDGAKSDIGNILDIFDKDNNVLIPDPVYPVYVDTNIMDGRKISYINATKENSFLPLPNSNKKADIIYICSPNNPTGAAYNHEQLKLWVDYAIDNKAIILFDAAYEAFISNNTLPRSIFEIEGASKCSIEFCSLSKTAGFTGTRCGYTIVPLDLEFDGIKLNKLWCRRQTTKFNGVAYIIQCAANSVFINDGLKQISNTIKYYKENARIISSALEDLNIWFTGGKNSPYVWLKCPNKMSSWEFFDYLLNELNIVGTPGSGFGKNGEGFFRLTAFGDRTDTIKATERLRKMAVN